MARKKVNIGSEDLKKYYIMQSDLIDSSQKAASEILEDDGYDLNELKRQGLELINSLKKKIELEKVEPSISWEKLVLKIEKAGITRQFLERRIIPQELLKSLRSNSNENFVQLAIDYLVAVFGWSKDEFLKSEGLVFNPVPAKEAFYKKPSNYNISQIKAYSHYAQFIAKISSKASQEIKSKEYPENLDQFRKLVLAQSGKVDLESILETVWGLGICVIPLTDSGVFHGACWNIEGRHVIILKQKTDSHAKWIFDLLHELYHVFVHLDNKNTFIVEESELSPIGDNDSEEEREANTFANQFIFGSQAEALAAECVRRANSKVEGLKQAVVEIAKERKIRVDFLANYVAYRLQYEGTNWWGSANRLQIKEPSPLALTKKYLIKRIDFNILNTIERNMLSMAID